MKDCFALLKLPRRPWLDPEELQRRFLALSAEFHPDHVGAQNDAAKRAAQAAYTDLNAAYNCLRQPNQRLRHLLELELGAKPSDIERIPPDLMNLFFEVSGLCRQVDAFLAQKAQATHALLKARMLEPSQEWTEKLQALLWSVASKQRALMAELESMNAEWGSPDLTAAKKEAALGRLEHLYRLSSYYARWIGQVQERLFQLSV